MVGKSEIKAFVERWQGCGREDEEDQKFWNGFLMSCLGVSPESIDTFIDYQHKVYGRGADGKYHRRKIDAYIPDHRVLIEQKSADKDLDKPRNNGEYGWETPFQQAHWYYGNMPKSTRPDWIITCNFQTFRIYDLDSEKPEEHYIEVSLTELPQQIHLFDFIKSEQTSRIYREQELSREAGDHVTRLYDALARRYRHIDTDEAEQRSLNRLITRIVFLLYAEDADLMQSHLAFGDYCQGDPTLLRGKLKALFKALDTPEDERDEYDDSPAAGFPYMNGGLFAENPEDPTIIPTLDEEVATIIAEVSRGFDWSGISPTIFGAVFESTLNPETRAGNGMHYTSVENIHRAIDPLFLNDLRRELHAARSYKSLAEQRSHLDALHDKIASIKVLDPACGSGNFLTETYLQLRGIENQILAEKVAMDAEKGRQALFVDDNRIRVSIGQLYGIEINDFAVAVAKTALWISEVQMLAKTREMLPAFDKAALPLPSNDNICEGNALKMDWEAVLPAEECSYICGNPPFLGARNQNGSQKAELVAVFDGAKNAGNIDYCAGWYVKAARYMALSQSPTRAALVSTNSICQGEQVANIWKPLYDMGIHIDFAHTTFRWDNEAAEKAHVFCIIVGFSRENTVRKLFIHDTPTSAARIEFPSHINAYLKEAPDVYVWSRSKPICEVPLMGIGSQPIDDGNYLFTDEEKAEFLHHEPDAARFFHPYVGSREFINGYTRWCIWLGEATWSDLKNLPMCRERIEAVRQFRLGSKRKQTLEAAQKPAHFGTEIIPISNSIIVPRVSSERRKYIPIGFIGPETFCSDAALLIPNATLYHFGVMSSQVHNAWMRTVCGRLKGDYRYSAGVVYNNFVWPDIGEAKKGEIADLAQDVLDARSMYDGATLADLYDPKNEAFFPELFAAHRALDKAVEEAYGMDFDGDEEKIVARLFELYAEATKGE